MARCVRLASRVQAAEPDPHPRHGERRREQIDPDHRRQPAPGRRREEPSCQGAAAGAGRTLDADDRPTRKTAAHHGVQGGDSGAHQRLVAQREGRRGRLAVVALETLAQGRKNRINSLS